MRWACSAVVVLGFAAVVAVLVGGCGDGVGGTLGEHPGITVSSPDGGQTWLVGTQAAVTWDAEGAVEDVTIELSTDAGATWPITLISTTPNDGSETVTVPDTPSAACRVRVSDIDGSPGDMSDADFVIAGATIALTITPTEATEGDGALTGQGAVSIPGTFASDLIVDISSSDETELTVPSSVAIPAGSTSATFDLTVVEDVAVDGTQTVTVTGSAAGWTSGQDTIDILDNCTKTVTVTIGPASATEGDGLLPGEGLVSIPGTYATDVVVSLDSDDTTELAVPVSVTILAGSTSATFDLTVAEDLEVDGTQTATVTGSAAGWTSGQDSIDILDNDMKTVTVAIGPASATEGDGLLSGEGLVSIPRTYATDIVVSLSSDDATELTVPVSVTIPAGSTSEPFTLVVEDDTEVDGPQTVTVTGSTSGWTGGQDTIDILDDELILVDVDATGAGDGTTWADAYTDLQSALTAPGNAKEIWVAEGMYKPGTSRTHTFQLVAGVALYGGFAGTETSRQQRDWATHATILSGDVNGDDVGFTNNDENCYRVVIGADNAVLDGFTICNGNADGGAPFNRAGGMLIATFSPAITNCIFQSNSSAGGSGGAMFISACSSSIENCLFVGNRALTGDGGAVSINTGSAPTFANCAFTLNSTDSHGGAIDNLDGSAAFINCVVWGNTAGISNPNVYVTSGTPAWSHCDLEGSGGSATWVGSFGTDNGGNIDVDPLFVDAASGDLHLDAVSSCNDSGTIIGASEEGFDRVLRPQGGGVDMGAYEQAAANVRYVKADAAGLNNGSSWTDAFTDLQFALASALTGDEIWVAAGTYRPGAMREDTFQLVANAGLYGGFAGTPGTEGDRAERDPVVNVTTLNGDIGTEGVDNDNCYHVVTGAGNVVLDGFTITKGYADGVAPHNDGAAMYNSSCSGLLIRSCTVSENYCSNDGAGIYNVNCTSLVVEGCTFSGNIAALTCGALGFASGSGAVLNCIFSNNSAGAGGGGIGTTGSSSIANCTFYGNSGGGTGSAIFADSSPDVANCIVWGNESPAFGGGGSPAVTYSDIQDGTLGTGSIQLDPFFVDPVGGDLRPRFDSPCIDAGDGGAAPEADIEDNARYDYPLTTNTGTGTPDYADMGAYEHAHAPGDLAWARRAGSPQEDDRGSDVAALSGCAAVVTGEFNGSTTFGPGEPSETTATAAGFDDLFIARFGNDGSLAWAKKPGEGWNPENEDVCDVAVLPDGSTVATGEFMGVADGVVFGMGEPNETTLVSAGWYTDIFVARYQPDGSLVWAKRAGGASGDSGLDVAALPDGSTLVTGEFRGTATFGPSEANETTLVSEGDDDIFIAKYGPDGSLVWAKAAGGAGDDRGRGVTALPDGGAVLTGEFEGTAVFGPSEPGAISLVSAGGDDIFVARYNTDGTLAWANRVGDVSGDRGRCVAALTDGSVVVTGEFEDTAVFGPLEPGETTLVSAGSDDIFVARYNLDGTLAWAKGMGSSSSDYGFGITARLDDSTVVTGEFASTVIFGLGDAAQTSLTSAGSDDVFIACYNPDGTLAWAKRAGGTGEDEGHGIAAFSDGSVVVTGVMVATATFGPGDPNEIDLTSAGDDDIFMACYDSAGALVWAKCAGGTGYDRGLAATFLSDGSVIVMGKFEGIATFGSGEANETAMTVQTYDEGFVAWYGADGNLSLLKRAGGTGDDEGLGIATHTDDSAVVTGFFYGSSVTFGPGEAGETVLTGAGTRDVFVARHDANGSLAWAKQAGGVAYEEGQGIVVLSDGSVVVVGRFNGSATFGATVLTSAGDTDIFVARYNSDGTVAWAESAGGVGDDEGHGITVLPDDSVVIAGEFEDTATFGTGGSVVDLVSDGYDDVFIARYFSDGTLDWAKRAGSAWGDVGNAVAAFADGSVVVAGYIDGLATFGPGEPGVTFLDNEGSHPDIFVARYNPDGSLAWAKRAGGGAGDDRAYGVCALPDDTTVVTGMFRGVAVFDPGEAGETSLQSAGDDDIFVARYDSAGALIWARRAGGLDEDHGNGVATLTDGSVVVTGYFGATAIFGQGTWSETALTSSGYADIFVARYYP